MSFLGDMLSGDDQEPQIQGGQVWGGGCGRKGEQEKRSQSQGKRREIMGRGEGGWRTSGRRIRLACELTRDMEG